MWLHLDIVQHHNFCNHCDQFHFDIDQLHIDDIDTFLCNIYLFYLSLRRTLSHHCKPLTFYIYQVRMFRKCTFRQDSNSYLCYNQILCSYLVHVRCCYRCTIYDLLHHCNRYRNTLMGILLLLLDVIQQKELYLD